MTFPNLEVSWGQRSARLTTDCDNRGCGAWCWLPPSVQNDWICPSTTELRCRDDSGVDFLRTNFTSRFCRTFFQGGVFMFMRSLASWVRIEFGYSGTTKYMNISDDGLQPQSSLRVGHWRREVDPDSRPGLLELAMHSVWEGIHFGSPSSLGGLEVPLLLRTFHKPFWTVECVCLFTNNLYLQSAHMSSTCFRDICIELQTNSD